MTRRNRHGGIVGVSIIVGLAILTLAGCAIEPGDTPTSGDETACPRGPAPVIEVAAAPGEPTRDDTLSVDELSHLGEVAYGKVALGATVAKLGIATQLEYNVAPSLGPGFCAYPTRVTFTVKFARRIVYVAREFRDEPCVHGEVLAHEQRHVMLDNRLLAEERTALAAGLSARLAAMDAGRGATEADAAQALARRIGLLEAELTAAFDLRRKLAHAEEIDTPAESRRAQTMCQGRIPQLLKALRRI